MRIKVKAAIIALAGGVLLSAHVAHASSWPASVVGTWDMLADQR
jgi:hypothetical protein